MNQDSPARKHLHKRCLVVGILMCATVVLGFIVWDISVDYRKQRYAARHFLPVEATILTSKAVQHGGGGAKSSSGGGTSWHPDITYQYKVGDKQYVSKRYSYSYRFHNSADFVQTVVAANPAGKKVTAYYHPDTPTVAVLDNTAPNITYIVAFFVLFGAIALGIGVYVVRSSLGAYTRASGQQPSVNGD